MNDNLVTFQTSEGLGLRGTLHRLTPEQAVFECVKSTACLVSASPG